MIPCFICQQFPFTPFFWNLGFTYVHSNCSYYHVAYQSSFIRWTAPQSRGSPHASWRRQRLNYRENDPPSPLLLLHTQWHPPGQRWGGNKNLKFAWTGWSMGVHGTRGWGEGAIMDLTNELRDDPYEELIMTVIDTVVTRVLFGQPSRSVTSEWCVCQCAWWIRLTPSRSPNNRSLISRSSPTRKINQIFFNVPPPVDAVLETSVHCFVMITIWWTLIVMQRWIGRNSLFILVK